MNGELSRTGTAKEDHNCVDTVTDNLNEYLEVEKGIQYPGLEM